MATRPNALARYATARDTLRTLHAEPGFRGQDEMVLAHDALRGLASRLVDAIDEATTDEDTLLQLVLVEALEAGLAALRDNYAASQIGDDDLAELPQRA